MKRPTPYGIASLILIIISLSAGCYGTVRPVQPAATRPSFDGNVANSGLLGFTTNHYAVITSTAAGRYNAYVDKYGSRFLPPLHLNDGLKEFTNGTWLLDKEHLEKFVTMTDWRRAE